MKGVKGERTEEGRLKGVKGERAEEERFFIYNSGFLYSCFYRFRQ